MEDTLEVSGPDLVDGAGRRSRRTQAERTTDMRRRICEATLETLCEVGFDRLSLAMVAEKARISRGAITHHFPSKSDILVGSFQHMIAEWQAERVRFNALCTKATLEDYLRFLWKQVFSRPKYTAAIGLMLAARADEELQAKLRSVLADWMKVRDILAEEILGPDVAGIPRARYMQISLSIMRGMAIHESIDVEEQTSEILLDSWISMTKRLIASQPSSSAAETRGVGKVQVTSHSALPS